jgi:Reverse transcriptase (RNA-dependent DNA polymerase)
VAGVSDHDALLANLTLNVVRPTRPPKTVFNYNRANWENLDSEFARRLPQTYIDMEINSAWELWKEIFFDCVKNNVPTKTFKDKVKSLPWLDRGIRKLIATRDKLFSKWHKNRTATARELYTKARNLAQRALRNAKDQYMWKLGTGPQGSKFFWSYISARSKVPINNTVFTDGGKIFSQPLDVASLFSQSFQKNFSKVTGIFPFIRRRVPVVAEPQPAEQTDFKITPGEVKNLMQSIKQNAAMGPDKIPANVLKNCSVALSSSLAALFTLSLKTGELPHEWKAANVTPIHKDGEKSKVKNYRPISVTSLVGKILEKHVRDRTADFLNQQKVFPDNQHGFRTGRSCTTMLLKTFEEWTVILDKKSGTHIHAIFLDWAKAFDKVPHERLLSKLEHYGIKGKNLCWFKNFLIGRTQRVVFGGAHSELTDVPSGVIQGSVLGPFLFNIFVADLPNCIKHCCLRQYADDCTLSKEIISEKDEQEVQEDLDSASVWCENNGMELNALKCKVMDITHARSTRHTDYKICGQKLSYVETERLLGVHISKDLKWNHHTDVVRKKAAQILGFAKRNLKGCTPRVKRTAYLTMVKPILFYGSPAWHPETKTNTDKIERMQRRALKFVYGNNLPPREHQKIMPVQMQLRYNDLLFFKKCETGNIDCNVRDRIVERRALRGGGSSAHPLLQPLPARTLFGERAFAFRVVGSWNNLPDRLKDCNADKFPGLLKAHLWQTVNV